MVFQLLRAPILPLILSAIILIKSFLKNLIVSGLNDGRINAKNCQHMHKGVSVGVQEPASAKVLGSCKLKYFL